MHGMKFIAAAGFLALTVSSPAWAAFTPAELLDVTKIAVDQFSTENPDHAPHFTGFKAWKSAENARVKIYVDHDGHAMEFDFTCHKHDEGLECHGQ